MGVFVRLSPSSCPADEQKVPQLQLGRGGPESGDRVGVGHGVQGNPRTHLLDPGSRGDVHLWGKRGGRGETCPYPVGIALFPATPRGARGWAPYLQLSSDSSLSDGIHAAHRKRTLVGRGGPAAFAFSVCFQGDAAQGAGENKARSKLRSPLGCVRRSAGTRPARGAQPDFRKDGPWMRLPAPRAMVNI